RALRIVQIGFERVVGIVVRRIAPDRLNDGETLDRPLADLFLTDVVGAVADRGSQLLPVVGMPGVELEMGAAEVVDDFANLLEALPSLEPLQLVFQSGDLLALVGLALGLDPDPLP